jgi:hypothetical protein
VPDAEYVSQQINSGVQGKIDGRVDFASSRAISREARGSYAFETRNKKGGLIHLNVIQK